MIGRILDGLRHRLTGEPPERRLRPNELSREVARADRLRREALQANATRAARSAAEEERAPRVREQAPAAPPAPKRRLSRSLRSRSNLREAWLAKEVLGPPVALRGFRGDLERPSIQFSRGVAKDHRDLDAAFEELADRLGSSAPSAGGAIAGPHGEKG